MSQMQLSSIEIEIIQFLFEHQNHHCSSQKIAKNSEVSSKTIRKYINSLNTILENYESVIEMKRGSGYRLIIKDKSQFYLFLDSIRDQNHMTEDTNQIIDNSDRERFILNILLLENQKITIEDLADKLFVSRSTISAVIQKIKKRLEKFDLGLSYGLEGNIMINGKELDKRRFILNYFFAFRTDENYAINDMIEFQYENFSAETIFIIVLEKCREFDIQLSDFVLQNLVFHIALAIKRIEKGFKINQLVVDKNIEYSKELFVAEKIVDSIEKIIEINFSKEEANYIALHLKSKSNNQKILPEQPEIIDKSLRAQIIDGLTQIKNENQFQFLLDQQLVKGIEVHFEPLLARLSLNIKLKNPLLEEVKEKYEEVFFLTKQTFSSLPVLSNYHVDDHEIAYIALHILAAIERYKQHYKVNVVVICATGLGSAQMLKNRLETTFASNMNIVNVISYYQLNDEILKDVDLIVTTIDMSTSFFNVPIVKVSVFLNNSDIEKLNQSLQNFMFIEQETDIKNKGHNIMNDLFELYFNETRFIVFDSSLPRDKVLKEMIGTLTDGRQNSFKEDLMKQIQVREQFGTLAFTNEVAFPHPAKPIGVNSEIAIGIIPTGLEWDANHKNTKIVVLMSPSRIENKGLDIINGGLAEYISNENNIQSLVQNTSFDHFKKSFIDTLNE